jgi:hypothetical protein
VLYARRKKEREKKGQVVTDLNKMWSIPENILHLRQRKD